MTLDGRGRYNTDGVHPHHHKMGWRRERVAMVVAMVAMVGGAAAASSPSAFVGSLAGHDTH